MYSQTKQFGFTLLTLSQLNLGQNCEASTWFSIIAKECMLQEWFSSGTTTAFFIHLLGCSNILDWLDVNSPRPKNSETNKSKLEIQAVRRKKKKRIWKIFTSHFSFPSLIGYRVHLNKQEMQQLTHTWEMIKQVPTNWTAWLLQHIHAMKDTPEAWKVSTSYKKNGGIYKNKNTYEYKLQCYASLPNTTGL